MANSTVQTAGWKVTEAKPQGERRGATRPYCLGKIRRKRMRRERWASVRAEAKEGEKTGVLRWEQSINYEANPRRFRNNSIGAVGIERWEKCDDERLL
jgi:hypothetical protein